MSANVERWRADVQRAVTASGNAVPVALVLAIIEAESGGAGYATRGEPQLGDASIGLMQVLYGTARASGYAGSVGEWNKTTNSGTGLYDVATNLRYGIEYLSGLLDATGGDVERTISAYNAGLGNAKRFTVATRFCLAWKPTAPKTGRNMDRDCANIYTAQPGEFGNQPYVTKVLAAMAGYAKVQGLPAVTVTATRSGSTTITVALVLVFLVLLLYVSGVI